MTLNWHFQVAKPSVSQVTDLLEVGDLIQWQTLLILDGMPQRLLHILHQEVKGSRILQECGTTLRPWAAIPGCSLAAPALLPMSLPDLSSSKLGPAAQGSTLRHR